MPKGTVTKGSEGPVAGAARSQILARLEPPWQCQVLLFCFKSLFPKCMDLGDLWESALSLQRGQGVSVLIE